MTSPAYYVLWFVFTLMASGAEPTGYIEPQDVQLENMQCGITGEVVGVRVDRQINPLAVTLPDPYFPGVHCRIDISARVAGLLPGEYHTATTLQGASAPFGTLIPAVILPDPHTSETWYRVVGTDTPPIPATLGSVRINPNP